MRIGIRAELCASLVLSAALFFAKIHCRNKESASGSLTRRVFVKTAKTRPKVCFDRFKITNAIRNIHAARQGGPARGCFIPVTRMTKPRCAGVTVTTGEKNNIVPDRWAPKCSLISFSPSSLDYASLLPRTVSTVSISSRRLSQRDRIRAIVFSRKTHCK